MKIFFTKNTWFERFFGRNGGRPLPPKKIRQIVFPQVKLIKVININTLLSSQFLNSQPQDQASWLSRKICGSRDCLGCKVSGAHIHFRFVFHWKCFFKWSDGIKSLGPLFLPSRPSWRGAHNWLRGHIWLVVIRAFVASQAGGVKTQPPAGNKHGRLVYVRYYSSLFTFTESFLNLRNFVANLALWRLRVWNFGGHRFWPCNSHF